MYKFLLGELAVSKLESQLQISLLWQGQWVKKHLHELNFYYLLTA